jgi:hypothetical protein
LPRLHRIEARWRSGDAEDCKATPNHDETAKVRSFTPDLASPEINDLRDDCELSQVFSASVATPFDRIELAMALRYSERGDCWPVGPEFNGRAWSCATPTVQIVQQPQPRRAKRFVVLTLFPFRYTDRRYPPSPLLTLHKARRFAFARLWMLAGANAVVAGRGPGIELVRGGDHLGLEVFL